MDVMEQVRLLGKAIQETQEYKAYAHAKEVNDNDSNLQDLIGQFNLLRMQINDESQKETPDEEIMKKINTDLQDCYATIMNNESMANYNVAKESLEAIINKVNGIIALCVDGQDPETCEVPDSCGGSCGSCGGGCH